MTQRKRAHGYRSNTKNIATEPAPLGLGDLSPSRVEYAAAIVEVYKKLAKIESLAEAPHWESERRWKIAGLAREAMNLLEEPTK